MKHSNVLASGLIISVAVVQASLGSEHAVASVSTPYSPTQYIRGGAGLIQTPTARMSPEGKFTVNYNDINEYRFWSASLQLFPWMESTVRYTDVRTQLYSPFVGFSGDQTLKDKGIDAKFRLLSESYYLPELSIGFLDIGGTGFFASEFVSASKRWGPIDFHLGIGTGYLGADGNIDNPLCKLSNSFCERDAGFSGSGGIIEFGDFFKGQTSIFGGIEYQTPLKGLQLKLEYDGNDYQNDRAGELKQDSKWNLGATYQYNNWDFNVSYQRGNTFGFGVSYHFNMNTIQQVKYDNPPRSLLNAAPATSIENIDRQRLYDDLVNEGSFLINATHQQGSEMTFYGVQLGYRDFDEATQRVGRILASELPESITRYNIVEVISNTPIVNAQIDAIDFKDAATYAQLENDITKTYTRVDVSDNVIENYRPNKLSGLLFSTEAFWIQTFGNPEDFYLYQGGAFVNTGYAFDANFSIRTGVKVTLLENFDKFNFLVDGTNSPLPRVRTQIREYVSRSNITLENAYLHWFDKIAPNTYMQVYGGYLETMFAGVGAEALYQPVNSNLAFGLDLNYVKQRDFDSDTALFDYKVVTGHASVYWQPTFLENMLLTVSAGQFLAKDKGVNIDFAKRFDSGIIVGAYAAFTNVSAADYGEGSFTKGFYLSIPFDLFSFAPAKGRGNIPWIPIGRDGGQMLKRPITLRDLTKSRSPFYD